MGVPVPIIGVRPVSRLPPAERRGYRNVFDALVRIVREEGILTLWRVNWGGVPDTGGGVPRMGGFQYWGWGPKDGGSSILGVGGFPRMGGPQYWGWGRS